MFWIWLASFIISTIFISIWLQNACEISLEGEILDLEGMEKELFC